MSKGLEALKEIELKWQYGVFTFIPNFEIIEKELKALEIIKNIKGLIEDEDLFYDSEEDKYYFFSNEISKEEYDLLKEVLLWD